MRGPRQGTGMGGHCIPPPTALTCHSPCNHLESQRALYFHSPRAPYSNLEFLEGACSCETSTFQKARLLRNFNTVVSDVARRLLWPVSSFAKMRRARLNTL